MPLSWAPPLILLAQTRLGPVCNLLSAVIGHLLPPSLFCCFMDRTDPRMSGVPFWLPVIQVTIAAHPRFFQLLNDLSNSTLSKVFTHRPPPSAAQPGSPLPSDVGAGWCSFRLPQSGFAQASFLLSPCCCLGL